jgi:xanthosine utilization system XapX-like protein
MIDWAKSTLAGRNRWFAAIAIYTLGLGWACVALGLFVSFKSLLQHNIPIQQPAALFAVGVLTLVATRGMWAHERWGRNLSAFLGITIGYAVAEAISRLMGGIWAPKAVVVVFAAVSIAFFTGAEGRALFRKEEEQAADESAQHENLA